MTTTLSSTQPSKAPLGRPLVEIGNHGLPWRQQSRLYRFRRDLEAPFRELGAVSAKVKNLIRSGCAAKARSLRLTYRLVQIRKGEIEATLDQELQFERSAARADETVDRCVAALEQEAKPPDPWLSALSQGFGFPFAPAARQQANGQQADAQAVSSASTRQCEANALEKVDG